MNMLDTLISRIRFHGLQFLLWLDQGANVISGGCADETWSSRAYRANRSGKRMGLIMMPVIDKIFFILFKQEQHCRDAYVAEIMRKQLPENFTRWMNE